MIYFTGDLHLWQPAILEYCDRPFADIETMRRAFVDLHNSKVNEDDTVFYLGDVGGPAYILDNLDTALPSLQEFKGRKILVCGNHDDWVRADAKAAATVFEEVYDLLVLKSETLCLALSHYPLEQWLGSYRGSINVHGHIHHPRYCNIADGLSYLNLPQRLCACVDMCDWMPVTLTELFDAQQPGVVPREFWGSYPVCSSMHVSDAELRGILT